ncbi:helix-turn-helix transcriptional regulator [Rhizobium tropici]|uniref:Helix-turn-helix transcriptional regulator n=1 Tax=Rhizobium tropici TaxID=398 RepID=A0A5B0W0U7_RHITR|nr:winged helix-turn-helix transcriptional regulator [Rhizobium tropici]KAA1180198.1 helix-turn-helix transcriptional regulator [Rhizobium tropici]
MPETGLISRTVYAGVPPHVEYRVTKEGDSLRPLIEFAEV